MARRKTLPPALPALRLLLPVLLALFSPLASAFGGAGACPNDFASGSAAHPYCGLPYVVGNFQSYFTCDDDSVATAPSRLAGGRGGGGGGLTEADIAAAVSKASAVRAVGLGHSWWREGWCPVPKTGATTDSARATTTTTTTAVIPLTQQQGVEAVSRGDVDATLEHVRVDKTAMTVTAPAGLSQRALLRALDHWDEIEEAGSEEENNPPARSTLNRRRNAPTGLTLEAFSWFVDQTMGGAVATASHGSSLQYGGLSSQLRAARLVLANGTTLVVRRPDAPWPSSSSSATLRRDAFLWRAVAASTGRLGVLTEVTMDVMHNEKRVRTSVRRSPDAFQQEVAALSAAYREAAGLGGGGNGNSSATSRTEAVWRAVRAWDERQAFWFVPSRALTVVKMTLEGGLTAAEFADARREAGVGGAAGGEEGGEGPPNVQELSADSGGEKDGAVPQAPSPPPPRIASYAATAEADNAAAGAWAARAAQASRSGGGSDNKATATSTTTSASDRALLRGLLPAGPLPAIERAPKLWSRTYELMISANTFNATLPARSAYVSCNEIESSLHSAVNAYDQFESAVPLERAGDCLAVMNDALYGDPQAWRGFRAPMLVRFVAGERAFLSPSHGGPVMYINLEDHVSYALGGGQGRSLQEREEGRRDAEKAAAQGKTPALSRVGTPQAPMMRNPEFDAVMRVLRGDVCRGRMHWGKAGWPLYASMGASWGGEEQRSAGEQPLPPSCFDGAAEYGQAWCSFGCAVAELDPTGKFEAESGADVGWWGAVLVDGGGKVATTSGAAGMVGASAFAQECCGGPDGFRADRCRCARRAEAGGAATCRSVVV